MLLISVEDAIGQDATEVRVVETVLVADVVVQLAMRRKKKMVKMVMGIRAMEEHHSKVKMESHVKEDSDLEDLVVVVDSGRIAEEMVELNMAGDSVVVNQNVMAILRMTELLENPKAKEPAMVTLKEIAHHDVVDSDASVAKVGVVKEEIEEEDDRKVVVAWVDQEDLALKAEEAEEILVAVMFRMVRLLMRELMVLHKGFVEVVKGDSAETNVHATLKAIRLA